jgi:hypothetical protein
LGIIGPEKPLLQKNLDALAQYRVHLPYRTDKKDDMPQAYLWTHKVRFFQNGLHHLIQSFVKFTTSSGLGTN